MNKLTQHTGLCGVVLHPAHHTRSPAMHNAAYEDLGVDAVYLAFDVPPEALAGAMAGARALRMHQLAVSIPHKVAVMEHLDEIDETARQIAAVNTATRVGDRWIGTNTDWLGAVRALEEQGQAEIRGAKAVVLGGGGAARAVVYGLAQRGAEVTILNRSVDRARELASELGGGEAGSLADLGDLEHQILVNTTSVGLSEDASPVDSKALRAGALVMDAVYEPENTRLLRDAEAAGCRTLGGKWMLVYQAAEQLRIWSGREAPIDVMAGAFDRAAAR